MNLARPFFVYVASSWRNPIQTVVCAALRSVGIDHYDFRNPPNGTGFSWLEVKTEVPSVACESCGGSHTLRGERCGCGPGVRHVADCGRPPRTCPDCSFRAKGSDWEDAGEYLRMIAHERALVAADAVVMVLPCGKSAHLELGWAVGRGKRTAILLDDPVEPELMYKMVDYLSLSLHDLLGWLGSE